MAGECMEFQVLFLVSFFVAFVVIIVLVAAMLRCVLCGSFGLNYLEINP